jgi:SPX domain protein involved in polyphosphate accumulation
MRITTAQRFELKYLIRHEQQQAIVDELHAFAEPDRYGDAQGSYAITSLYYDSPDHKAYWDKIEGQRFRRKVRVRTYGEDRVTPETAVFVEIKQRRNKTLQKKRVRLPYAAAVALDEYDRIASEMKAEDRRVLEEVAYLARTLRLQPACVVRYQRLAFNGTDANPDLRITFDTTLQARTHDLSLLSTGFADDTFFLSPNWAVMEVKVNRTAPYWLSKILRTHGATAHRFSKYCVGLEHCLALRGRQGVVLPAINQPA